MTTKPFLERLKVLSKINSGSLGYSTLQPDLDYFDSAEGYIAFKTFGFLPKFKSIIVLGDPIATPPNQTRLIDKFLDFHHRPTFLQINEQTANHLKTRGYFIEPMGDEHVVDLKSFKCSWASHPSFRRACNKAAREGVTIQEVSHIPIQEVQEISNHWFHSKKSDSSMQSFLTRPVSNSKEPDVRLFVAKHKVPEGAKYPEGGKNKIVGFRVYDPIYQNGEVAGYFANINRVQPTAPAGTSYLLALEAMKTFQNEKRYIYSLGISPFSGRKSTLQKKSITAAIFEALYKSGNHLYGFQGLKNHKQRFHGTKSPTYYASPARLPLLSLLQTYKLTTGKIAPLFNPKNQLNNLKMTLAFVKIYLTNNTKSIPTQP